MKIEDAPLAALTRMILGERQNVDDQEDWLPDGVIATFDYRLDVFEYLAECRGCGELKPIYCDLEEIPQTGYEHWCGGSPRCCP